MRKAVEWVRKKSALEVGISKPQSHNDDRLFGVCWFVRASPETLLYTCFLLLLNLYLWRGLSHDVHEREELVF